MKGTNGMLPTTFDYQPKNSKDKIMEAEKPVELIEEIIEYINLLVCLYFKFFII